MTDETTPATPEFDVESGVASIAKDIFGTEPAEDKDETPEIEVELPDGKDVTPEPTAEELAAKKVADDVAAAAAATATQTKPPPKSWEKDKHELWSKLPPDAQDYYAKREQDFLNGIEMYKGEASFGKSMREALTPYKAIIDAQGISEPQAVQYLLNAHYRLTQGSPEQRMAAYQQLGRNLGLVQGDPANPDQPLDPKVRELQERQERIESALTARQEAEYQASLQRTSSEVQAFSSDPAHQYFDELCEDIATLIRGVKASGGDITLAEAYERTVWANPVTRAKEQGRLQTEAEARLREKAKTDAEAARKATAANMRGLDTRRPPTEAKGSMDDTLRDTMSKIRDRAH